MRHLPLLPPHARTAGSFVFLATLLPLTMLILPPSRCWRGMLTNKGEETVPSRGARVHGSCHVARAKGKVGARGHAGKRKNGGEWLDHATAGHGPVPWTLGRRHDAFSRRLPLAHSAQKPRSVCAISGFSLHHHPEILKHKGTKHELLTGLLEGPTDAPAHTPFYDIPFYQHEARNRVTPPPPPLLSISLEAALSASVLAVFRLSHVLRPPCASWHASLCGLRVVVLPANSAMTCVASREETPARPMIELHLLSFSTFRPSWTLATVEFGCMSSNTVLLVIPASFLSVANTASNSPDPRAALAHHNQRGSSKLSERIFGPEAFRAPALTNLITGM